MPLAAMNAIDPADAAALALKAYLEAAVFCVPGPPETTFRLERVGIGWPENFEELKYPSCSITSATIQEDAHHLTPSALEETLDQFCPGTVLWKTAELAVNLQVDFWCSDQPTQRAIRAALGALFNPTEGRAGILLQGPREYWDQAIRFSLVSRHRVDSHESAMAKQRRLTVMVLADVDVVHLRKAARLEPRIWLDGEPVVLEPVGPT